MGRQTIGHLIAKWSAITLLVIGAAWLLSMYGIMKHIETNIGARTLQLKCRGWSMTCLYKLDHHGMLEDWLFGVAAQWRMSKFVPCGYIFNSEHSFTAQPSWLRYIFPIRLCPEGWSG